MKRLYSLFEIFPFGLTYVYMYLYTYICILVVQMLIILDKLDKNQFK